MEENKNLKEENQNLEEQAPQNTPNNGGEKKPNKFLASILLVFKTLWRWLKRMTLGASKEMVYSDQFKVERLESPGRIAVQRFFKKKVAVTALVVFALLFAFVFIAPAFVKNDLSYSDPAQGNLQPNMSLRAVPGELASDVRLINGTSSFSVGVSNKNKLYAWGVLNNVTTRVDIGAFPEAIKDDNVALAAAGKDHAVALTTDGHFVGWGSNSLGQYGTDDTSVIGAYPMDPIFKGELDPNLYGGLYACNQITAAIYDSKLYVWGNKNALTNIASLNTDFSNNVKKAAFGYYRGIVLDNNGKIHGYDNQELVISERDSSGQCKVYPTISSYLSSKTVVDIAASDNVFYVVTSEGVLCAFGAANYGEDNLPLIPEGEKVVSVTAGGKHAIAITDANKAYSFGYDSDGQASFSGVSASYAFAASRQTYLANENHVLTNYYGLQGYLMGTDSLGRDTFARIVHGGRMTMTIGAVSVIISTIIAIIVGVLSGFFGGWVDMLLMRLTEIVGAIPFLPFAMLLSHVLTYTPVDETTRIFIIMVILGVLSWTGLAHMIRGQVLAEREKDFVLAAKAMGVKSGRIAFKHVLPNVVSIIFVSVTLDFAGCLLTESSLSYLGFGVQQPRSSWGNMLNAARNDVVIRNYWWQWVFPAIFLAIATICINIIGDALRDVLDPKGSGER